MNCNPNECGKTPNTPCTCEPIILPTKTCVVNQYHPVEQPIIVPMHTRVVHNYIPVNRYYPQYTTSEEICCRGQSHPVED